MKKTRKFAALLAAMMAVSAMGAMSANSAEQEKTSANYQDGGASNSADVGLKINLTEHTDTLDDVVLTGTNRNDTENHVWNVTIGAEELIWNVTRTTTVSGASYGLKWDAETHKYVKDYSVEGGAERGTNNSTVYALTDDETAEKTYTVKNNSNFDVTYGATLVDVNDDYNNADAWFKFMNNSTEVTSLSNINIATNNDTTTTVKLKVESINTSLASETTLYANANITFSAGNSYSNTGSYAAE